MCSVRCPHKPRRESGCRAPGLCLEWAEVERPALPASLDGALRVAWCATPVAGPSSDCTGTLPGDRRGARAAGELQERHSWTLQRQMADRQLPQRPRLPLPWAEQGKAGLKATSVPEPGGLLWLSVGEACPRACRLALALGGRGVSHQVLSGFLVSSSALRLTPGLPDSLPPDQHSGLEWVVWCGIGVATAAKVLCFAGSHRLGVLWPVPFAMTHIICPVGRGSSPAQPWICQKPGAVCE